MILQVGESLSLSGDVDAKTKITGSNFADTLAGSDANDLIRGLGGDDYLLGQTGDDTLLGGSGNDRLNPGAGNDVVDGGGGFDTFEIVSSTGLTVSLALQGQIQATGAGDVLITNVEGVLGGLGDDHLTGDAANNYLSTGDGGADTLVGGGGDDFLDIDETGDRSLFGGAGADTVRLWSWAEGSFTVNLNDTQAQDTGFGVISFKGVENISLNSPVNSTDTLIGDGHDNVFGAGWGDDSLVGGGGSDTLLGDGAIAEDFNGGVLHSEVIEETSLVGMDTLRGGAGDDILVGGYGADVLVGGAGADLFVFLSTLDSLQAQKDLITDLTSADQIDLSGIDADHLVDGDQAFHLVDHFTGAAGELVRAYVADKNVTHFSMDVDGDGKADMDIVAKGDDHDFVGFVL